MRECFDRTTVSCCGVFRRRRTKLCATRFVELVFVSMMCVCVLGIICRVVFLLQKGEKLSLCAPALASTTVGEVKEFDSNACMHACKPISNSFTLPFFGHAARFCATVSSLSLPEVSSIILLSNLHRSSIAVPVLAKLRVNCFHVCVDPPLFFAVSETMHRLCDQRQAVMPLHAKESTVRQV